MNVEMRLLTVCVRACVSLLEGGRDAYILLIFIEIKSRILKEWESKCTQCTISIYTNIYYALVFENKM